MPTIEENIGEWGDYMGSYSTLIESAGYEVIESEYLGSYQGDVVMFVKTPAHKYGFLTFGYGSCSGCDALQACYDDVAALTELRDRLIGNGTYFDSMEELITWTHERDWEGCYWGWTEDGFQAWLKQMQEKYA